MKRKIVNIFFLLLFSLFTVSAQSYKSSDEILNKVSQKLNQGIEAEFIISRVIDKKNIEEEFSGSIIMKVDNSYVDYPLM